MYDPFPDDLYNEWIELYNPTNQTVNLSGWMITDNYRTDTLEPDFDHSNGTTLLPPQGYAIITDKGTTMYENYTVAPNTISLYVDDNRIGNGLGNTKDKLILRDPNATVHDMIEWGDDYEDIPGFPINDIDENHTLSRYPNTDTDDTSEDFYDAIIPSPGTENIETVNETITIDMYPECVPKIPSTAEYSIPFAVHISLQNFSANTTYQIKPYVVGKSNSMYPASQYWNDSSWQYAFYYTPLQTNFEGSWSGWYYLRLKKEYQEYQNNIEHNSSAFFILKLKTNTTVYEHTKQLQVLDLDESTTNGTTGGYHVGLLTVNETLYDNSLLMMTNNTGAITSLYRSEDNSIDEGLIPIPGYFKLPSPTGENYTLQIIDDNGTCIQSISNITITSGDYALDISTSDSQFYLRRSQTITIPIHLSNTGTFTDTFTININQITPGWHAELNTTQITLESGQSVNISLHLIPIQVDGENNGQLTLYATSLADIGATSTLDLCFEILGPDLLIPKIKCYDQYKKETFTVGQGEPLQIKAYIKNIGNENGGPFTVSFYYDKKDIQHHIETKKYDSITRYQKYPSITWDTTLVPAGKHTIYVVADSEEQLEERDETNNQNHILVNLTYTWQNNSKYLMITELYYHTHSTVKNEFITISNPSPFAVDISNWYITNTPEKQKTDQKKILFPSETTLRPYCSICLTQNASDFCWETGVSPDFEYLDDADKNIPQMHMKKTVTLSNKGGALALKDTYNHTIDMIVYGDTTYNGIGWNGVPVNDSGTAVILKRNKDTNAGFFDTNTSFDWDHPRRYGIGQSSFLYTLLNVSGNVTMFVSPDSSFPTIVSELCNATQSIDINMYEFTNPFLCDTLLSVLQKNITVRLFLEGSPHWRN